MSIIQGPAHDLLTGNDRAVIDPVSQVDEHVFMCGSAVGSGLLVSNARMLKNLKNLQGGNENDSDDSDIDTIKSVSFTGCLYILSDNIAESKTKIFMFLYGLSCPASQKEKYFLEHW